VDIEKRKVLNFQGQHHNDKMRQHLFQH